MMITRCLALLVLASSVAAELHLLEYPDGDARDGVVKSGLLIGDTEEQLVVFSYQRHRNTSDLLEHACGSSSYEVQIVNFDRMSREDLSQFACWADWNEAEESHVLEDCDDPIYLYCLTVPDPEWQFSGAGLYRAEGDSVYEGGNAGVVLINLAMSDGSDEAFGTLCDDYFNDHSAGIACRHLGFAGVIEWGNVGNNDQYISDSTLRALDLYTVVDDMRCPEGAWNVTDCDVDLMDHNCSPYESVWLVCDDGTDPGPEPTPAPEPEWQFNGAGLYRAEDGSIVEGGNAGVVLIHVSMSDWSEEAVGTLCDDYFNDHSAGIACRSLGFEGLSQWGNVGNNDRYISDSLLREHELFTVVDNMRCPEGAWNVTDCDADLMDHNCSPYESVWLECIGSSPEPTPEPEPEPEWQFMGAGLFHAQDGSIVHGGNAGVVLIHLAMSDGSDEAFGTLCDDYFNDHSAGIACRSLGFEGLSQWGNVGNTQDYISDSLLREHELFTVVDNMRCPEGAWNVTDCDADLMDHNCSPYESVWLECIGSSPEPTPEPEPEPEWQFMGAALFHAEEGSIVHGGNAGVVLIHVAMSDGSDQVFGTLCDDYFNDHSAGIACRSLGFDGVIEWGNVGNNEEYISQSLLRENELYTVVDDMRCPEGAWNVTDCDANLIDHNCSPYESVWLECDGYTPEPTPDPEPEWGVMGAGLYRIDESGEIVSGRNAGVVLVHLATSDGSRVVSGTLCDDSFNDHAAELACQFIGYDGVRGWGNVERNGDYISVEQLRQFALDTVVDEMMCPDAAADVSSCTSDLMDHDCSEFESVWLDCAGGEDGEDGDEDDDEGNFFELDFKGVKVGLKLGDFQGRIRF